MSNQDSGIVRDMSESVGSRSSNGVPISVRFSTHTLIKGGKHKKEGADPRTRLSPVKSSSSLAQHGGVHFFKAVGGDGKLIPV